MLKTKKIRQHLYDNCLIYVGKDGFEPPKA